MPPADSAALRDRLIVLATAPGKLSPREAQEVLYRLKAARAGTKI